MFNIGVTTRAFNGLTISDTAREMAAGGFRCTELCFVHSDLSGWTYTVNGEKINIGCDKYIPRDGDVIVWSYSNTLGD